MKDNAMKDNRFYAVLVGREGPKIYDSHSQCIAATHGHPGQYFKGFARETEATLWLKDQVHDTLALVTDASHRFDSGTAPTETKCYYGCDRPSVTNPCFTASSETCYSGIRSAIRRLREVVMSIEPCQATLKRKRDCDDSNAVNELSLAGMGASAQNGKCRVTLELIQEMRGLIRNVAKDLGLPPATQDPDTGRQSLSPSVEVPSPPIPLDDDIHMAEANDPPLEHMIRKTVPNAIQLSKEQQEIFELVKAGENVFFTGSAGTGKSILLKSIVKHFRQNEAGAKTLAVTSTTGISSLNIDGRTLHSWAGIQLGKEDATRLAEKIDSSKFHKAAWRDVKTLIIDEISMLSGLLFDKLEFIARFIRENQEPFGGIQLVLSGDFFQLPPVPERDGHERQWPQPFAFEAESWSTCIRRPVMLTHVFRQEDKEFVRMLNRLKIGNLDAAAIARFQSLSRSVPYDDGIEPSLLFATKREVAEHNANRLRNIQAQCHEFRSVDSRGRHLDGTLVAPKYAQALLGNLPAPREISLKVGAQVMLVRNLVQGQLVNGSLGKVTDFMTILGANHAAIEIAQVPHGDDSDNSDKKDSRVRSALATANCSPIVNSSASLDLIGNPGQILRPNQSYPVVKFENGMQLLCVPIDWDVPGFAGNIEARRTQVPLILSWALSIHKSQGQTISRLKVDLKNVFENGQAYVALSRARDMENLQVVNFDPARVKVHQTVVQWAQSWMSEEEKALTFGEQVSALSVGGAILGMEMDI